MTTEEIYEVLTSLGYELQDRGSYWQTNAVFRQGDNKTALQIYKDTGVWRDFVNNTPPLRFERLVEQSLGKDHPDFQKFLNSQKLALTSTTLPVPKTKLKVEETYPIECLKKLLPHYRFYNDKGISAATLEALRGGLATEGQMYQRFVFPIFNEEGQIHGFSGRDMLNKPNRPKWKHIGKKSQWIYPAYLPYQKSTFLELIEDDGTVILVESIGDLLSLHEQGYYNVLVTFGLDISPTLISVLVQLNPQRILLCFNNDTDAEENRGLTASFKNYLKLLSYIDYQKLFICLPTANDFGDMTADNFEKWKEKVDNLNPLTHSLQVLDGSQSLADQKKLSKKLLKNRNILKEIHDV